MTNRVGRLVEETRFYPFGATRHRFKAGWFESEYGFTGKERDREWNEDAARKQLLKIFEALGPTHPATVNGRRKLSSMLFS